jgi:hypothetical protein
MIFHLILKGSLSSSFLTDYQAVPVGVTDITDNPQGGTTISPTSPVWQHSRRAQTVSVFPKLSALSSANSPKFRANKYPQDDKLYKSASAGRFLELKELLEKSDVNSVDSSTGCSALHGAVQSVFSCFFLIKVLFLGKNKEMVVYLLNKGGDVNIPDRRGQSPLHISIEKR